MRWLQIRATVTKAQVALAETLMQSLGAVSVILDDAQDQALLEPLPGETPLWDQVIVTGLFTNEADAGQLEGFLSSQLTDAPIHHDYLEEQVWERAWMDHYEPIQCGERLWIVPEWLSPPNPDAINLMLDPGLAFGTGNHASTFLCLQWLDQQDLKDKVVIDYGCGSGILGIAALLLGAKQVYAVDLDPQAVLSTQQNAALNGVAEHIWCGLPEEFEQQFPALQADVIVANILAGPLMHLAENFAALAKPNAQIAMAGIIEEQVEDLKTSYAKWFNLHTLGQREENWCRLSGERLASA
ncbi:50S ribosomal protein L11 methyltransferase [Alkanindiges sp. WGS2144]|uniref:50S ribosomal protein L11 methyltransferase n=1 Tax=Alkanindiges sp. WGS2144 TaxID=3366808 RepID=UPI0037523BB9